MMAVYGRDLDEALAIGDALVRALDRLEYAPGKRLRQGAVYQTWAEPEEGIEVPSIAILPRECMYDSSHLSPHTIDASFDEQNGLVLWRDAEFVERVEIHIVTTDPIQRAQMVLAVREALQDATGDIYGIELSCPRYFGGYARVRVTPLRVSYEDSPGDTVSRLRIARLEVECRIPVLRVTPATYLEPRVEVKVDGEEV